MKKALAALSAASLLVMLTGCGQVQETAQSAASDAASKVAGAAADQIKQQACALVEDGLISVKDKELLGGLVAGAETAGVPVRDHDAAAADRSLGRPGSGGRRQVPQGRLRQPQFPR